MKDKPKRKSEMRTTMPEPLNIPPMPMVLSPHKAEVLHKQVLVVRVSAFMSSEETRVMREKILRQMKDGVVLLSSFCVDAFTVDADADCKITECPMCPDCPDNCPLEVEPVEDEDSIEAYCSSDAVMAKLYELTDDCIERIADAVVRKMKQEEQE